MNFNLNMKYDYVRVKQKHLILISQHHWSPTTSHPPPLHPLLWPLLLPCFAFRHPCFFGNLKKLERGRLYALQTRGSEI